MTYEWKFFIGNKQRKIGGKDYLSKEREREG